MTQRVAFSTVGWLYRFFFSFLLFVANDDQLAAVRRTEAHVAIGRVIDDRVLCDLHSAGVFDGDADRMIFQSRTLWSESIRMWSDDPSQEFFFREDLFAFRGPIFWARKGNVLEYLFYIRFEGLHIALRGKERQHFDKRYFPYNTLPETVQHSIMFSWIVMAWRANVHFFFLSWLWGSNHF